MMLHFAGYFQMIRISMCYMYIFKEIPAALNSIITSDIIYKTHRTFQAHVRLLLHCFSPGIDHSSHQLISALITYCMISLL